MPLELNRARAALLGGAERVFDLDEPILAAPADERVGLAPELGHEVEPTTPEGEHAVSQGGAIRIGLPRPPETARHRMSSTTYHPSASTSTSHSAACNRASVTD